MNEYGRRAVRKAISGLKMGRVSMILKTSAQSCALVLAVAAAVLAGCSSNADGDGDGQVSQKERATEMRRDGYLAM